MIEKEPQPWMKRKTTALVGDETFWPTMLVLQHIASGVPTMKFSPDTRFLLALATTIKVPTMIYLSWNVVPIKDKWISIVVGDETFSPTMLVLQHIATTVPTMKFSPDTRFLLALATKIKVPTMTYSSGAATITSWTTMPANKSDELEPCEYQFNHLISSFLQSYISQIYVICSIYWIQCNIDCMSSNLSYINGSRLLLV